MLATSTISVVFTPNTKVILLVVDVPSPYVMGHSLTSIAKGDEHSLAITKSSKVSSNLYNLIEKIITQVNLTAQLGGNSSSSNSSSSSSNSTSADFIKDLFLTNVRNESLNLNIALNAGKIKFLGLPSLSLQIWIKVKKNNFLRNSLFFLARKTSPTICWFH